MLKPIQRAVSRRAQQSTPWTLGAAVAVSSVSVRCESTQRRACSTNFTLPPNHHQPSAVARGEEITDPRTWPKTWGAADIQQFLEPHLKPGARLNFRGLAFYHREGDFESLNLIYQGALAPVVDRVDVALLLDAHLNNLDTPASVALQERDGYLVELENGLSLKDKNGIVVCYAMRGSGKTQLIKYFVHSRRLNAAAAGRVIVRCCDRARDSEWHIRLLDAKCVGDVRRSLCMLIKEHVEEVTKRAEDDSHFTTPTAAFARWVETTSVTFAALIKPSAVDFRPLIILDTCEVFDVQSGFSVHGNNDVYTLLEEFCLAIPHPYAVFVIGCSASIQKTSLVMTHAHVTKLPTLKPLSAGAHRAAIESWGHKMDKEVQPMIYELSGGLPRILLNAHRKENSTSVTLGWGAVTAVATRFKSFMDLSQTMYEICPEHKWPAYVCLLVSSSRIPVALQDSIPLPQCAASSGAASVTTYEAAIKASLCTYDHDTRCLVVPPIIATDSVLDLVSKTNALYPKPSDLHPLLHPHNHTLLGSGSPMVRGQHFERPFLYTLYARYLVLTWMRGDLWVPLCDVLGNSMVQLDLIGGIEVNLSKGVLGARDYTEAHKNAVTYNGSNKHHDAYLWCRRNGEEHPMALQLRHGQAKGPKDLKAQLKQQPSSCEEVVLPLLSVNQAHVKPFPETRIVMVNASVISTIAWLNMITPLSTAKTGENV